MGDVVALRQRDPYLRDVELMLQKEIEDRGSTEVGYVCADREIAGVLSRRLRSELKRRGWPVKVQQFRTRVYVWRVLTPEEEERAMRAVGEAAGRIFEGLQGPHLHLVPDPRTRRRR